MIRRGHRQLALAQMVLFGLITRPEDMMDPELLRIDALLDDEALVEQVLLALRRRRKHSAHRGRYGTPAEVVLRMLVLKQLKSWTFDRLEWEVKGNFVYRRFCRIDANSVPDAKTLVRASKLLDGPVLRAVYERITTLAVEQGVARGARMRVDTTVVEAPIRYPTDSGLLEDSVRVLRRHVRRIVAAGVELARPVRDTSRSVKRAVQRIAQIAKQRGDEAKELIKVPYKKLLAITGRWIRQAEDAVTRGRSVLGRISDGRDRLQRTAARSVESLATMIDRARRVVRQTRARVLRGITTSQEKLISIFEPHAQILRRGKPHKPTEFGMLVKVQESEGGLVTDIAEVPEKADAPLLVPSAERHLAVFGRAPDIVATDRGFHSSEAETKLAAMGVKTIAVPKPGYRSKERIAQEKKRAFRRGRAWRAGGEARIAHLKHDFGMGRSRYKGATGTHRTIHWAAIANNLRVLARRAKPP